MAPMKNTLARFTVLVFTVVLIQCLLPFPAGVPACRAASLEEVVVQLNWKHQFEFAGFYAAMEKGFYREAGLRVTLRELTKEQSALEEVVSRRANYGVWGAGWIQERIQGLPLVMLANYFKQSALVLMCRPSIRNPGQLAGKRIMATREERNLPEIVYMLKKYELDPENVNWLPHSFRTRDLTNGSVDAMTAYFINQPHELDSKGLHYSILDPAGYGADFYGDSLYASEEEIRRYPLRTRRFVLATNRGWQYALEHPDEIIDLILSRYSVKKSREALEYEARGIVRLMMPSVHPVGSIDKDRIRRIADIHVNLERAPSDYDLSGFVYDPEKGELSSVSPGEKVLLADFRMRPPHMYIRDNRPHGPLVTIIETAAANLGYRVEWRFRTFQKSVRGLMDGETDIVPRLYRTEARERFVHYLGPVSRETKTVRFIVPEEYADRIRTYEDLAQRSIGLKEDGHYFNRLDEDPSLRKLTATGDNDLALMFKNGRIDTIAVYDHEIMEAALKSLNVSSYAHARFKVSEKTGIYYALSRKSPLQALSGPLSKQLSGMLKDGTIDRIYARFAPRRIDLTPSEKAFIEAHPRVTVANEDDWPPFDFSVGGRPQGFSIDILNLLAERIGIQLEYINGFTWDELMAKFYAGELDVIHALNRTEEREKYGLFTRAYYHDRHVLVRKKGDEGLQSVADLKGRRLAFPKGFALIEHFRKHHPEIPLVEAENVQMVLEMISSGDAAGTVEQERVAGYFIRKYGFRNLAMDEIPGGIMDIGTSPMHIAIHRDKPLLHAMFVKALATVPPGEVEKLQRKWFGSDDGTAPERPMENLTRAEEAFLGERGEITFSLSPDRLPFEALKNGLPHGMAADFVKLFEKRTGTPFRMLPPAGGKNPAEMLTDPAKQEFRTLFPMITPTREGGRDLDFTSPFLHYTDGIIVRQDMPFITDLGDLEKKKIGIVENDPIWDFVSLNYPDIRKTPVESAHKGLLKLSSGGLDAFLIALPVATYTIQEMGLTNLKVAGHLGPRKAICVGVPRDDPALYGIMEKVVNSLTKEEIDDIYRKWVSVRFEHQVDYSLLWKLAGGAALIFAGFTLWNRKLSRLNRQIAEAHTKLAEKTRELGRLSVTDRLTGISNRMKLDQVLSREHQRAHRYGEPFCFILLDVDKFKSVNDTFGHQAGDAVLKDMANLLSAHVRKTDTVGRWGGEEFVVICPGTDLAGGARLAEKLRAAVENHRFPVAGSVTASFGVTLRGRDDDDTLQRADQALYTAKRRGRNRVEKAV